MFVHGKRQGGANRAIAASPSGQKAPRAPRSILPTGKRAAARAGFQAVATLADDIEDELDEDAGEREDGKAPRAAAASPAKPKPKPGRPALTMDL